MDFTSKIDSDGNETCRQQLTTAHLAAFQMVEIVKESKHLQKNLQRFLQDAQSPVHQDYLALRQHLTDTLCRFHAAAHIPARSSEWQAHLDAFAAHTDTLDGLRGQILAKLRRDEIDGLLASSLMNDLNYAHRIGTGLLEVLHNAADAFAASAAPPEHGAARVVN
uniref:Uncharacterized protein n=1 Tax=Conchiformibius kuhniae TaxID=211502 RepID=A0A8T9MXF6_9NEIS|nr:hypothetical protein LVJ77_02055 [Conchiformibius kuhniae]